MPRGISGEVIASFESWLHAYAPAAEWAVASGTLLLAIGTGLLAWQAKREAQAVREANEGAIRPYVFAAATSAWSRDGRLDSEGLTWHHYLPLTNGGPGPAISVGGWVEMPNGELRQLVATTIPGNSRASVLFEQPLFGDRTEWDGRNGVLWYHDILGQEWNTRFTIWRRPGVLWIDSAAVPDRGPMEYLRGPAGAGGQAET